MIERAYVVRHTGALGIVGIWPTVQTEYQLAHNDFAAAVGHLQPHPRTSVSVTVCQPAQNCLLCLGIRPLVLYLQYPFLACRTLDIPGHHAPVALLLPVGQPAIQPQTKQRLCAGGSIEASSPRLAPCETALGGTLKSHYIKIEFRSFLQLFLLPATEEAGRPDRASSESLRLEHCEKCRGLNTHFAVHVRDEKNPREHF